MKVLGMMIVALALGLSGALFAADAATKPAMPCCGEACKTHADCCKMVDNKAVCAMGGSCCVKAATTPAK